MRQVDNRIQAWG